MKSFHYLLGSPFCSGMIRRIEVNDFSPFVMQNDKHIQYPECCRWDGGRRSGEKIY